MDTYFFDLRNGDSILIDDNGLDQSSESAARRLALEFLGQKILNGAVSNAAWFAKIEVRNRSEMVMRVSTSVIVDDLNS